MLKSFFSQVEQVIPLSDDLKTFLSLHLRCTVIKPGGYLLKPRQKCASLCFLVEGAMHSFRVVGNRRQTCYVYSGGELCIDPESYFSGVPSKEYIAAIVRPCKVCELTRKDHLTAYARFPEWRHYFNCLLVDGCATSGEIVNTFRVMTAQERYAFIHAKYQLPDCAVGKIVSSLLGIAEGPLHNV